MSKCDSVKIQIEELILKLDYVTEEEADGLTRKLHDTLRKGIQKWICQVHFLIFFCSRQSLQKSKQKFVFRDIGWQLFANFVQTNVQIAGGSAFSFWWGKPYQLTQRKFKFFFS